MHSPPIDWSLDLVHFIVKDAIRDQGEPDGDTATEVLRALFHVDTPEGRAVLAAAIAAGAVGLYRHLVKPSMRPTKER